MKETIYLIDGSAYVYRAYFGVAPLTTSAGMPTQAVFGFVNIIQRLLKEKQPKYLAIAFDSRGPVFRHAMYADYKANRPAMPEDLARQVPYIRRYVDALNILCLQQDGVEADDLIASAAKTLTDAGHQVTIISGDKDLLQLISDDISMWEPMKDSLYTADAVRTKYNVLPSQLLDIFALIGDSSDNVPGVAGIGPKTAEKLINEFGTLDNLYAQLDAIKASKNKERLIVSRESAFLSRDLIRLKDTVSVPSDLYAYSIKPAFEDQLRALYGELEFTRFLKEEKKKEPVSDEHFVCVRSVDALTSLLAVLLDASCIVLDTETTSLDARKAKIVGVSFSVCDERAWYIPLNHVDASGEPVPGQLSEATVRTMLAPVLQSQVSAKLGHNLKYDYLVLNCQWGIQLAGQLLDTLVAAHLLEVSSRSLKLDDLCERQGLQLTSYAEVTGGDKREDAFAFVGIDEACRYSCEDVFGAWRVYQEFKPLLEEKKLTNLFFQVEMPLIGVLAAMEKRGISLDPKKLQELSVDFATKLQMIEQEIYDLAGQRFNILSPKQLGEILFEQFKLPHGKKTKTGYSTDVSVLEKLAYQHPLPAKILEFRTITKLQTTYVDKLAQLQDPVSGRVHTSFNQAVTATGRLSSTNPNLQNIPIRSEDGNRIRSAFIPATGLVFLSADYSQIDLRVLAHYSQDAALMDAFVHGEDIHSRTAAEVFGVSSLFVTQDMRRVAKSINFGIVYGMSSFGLSNQLGIGRKEAQTFIDRYFRHYSGVKRFMEEIVEQARINGYVTTLLGRRRTLPDILAKNKTQREFAERTAINTPIQGTAAEIIKCAMLKVEDALIHEKIPARLLLQIHDELIFELPEESVDTARATICCSMENALTLSVPLVVNCSIGHNLAK